MAAAVPRYTSQIKHLLNLDSMVLLQSGLCFCITFERELARAHVHVVQEAQRAQSTVCIFVFGKRKVLQRDDETIRIGAKYLHAPDLENSRTGVLSTLQRQKLKNGSARSETARQVEVEGRRGEGGGGTLPQRESILLMRLLSASEGMPLTKTTVFPPSFGSAIMP